MVTIVALALLSIAAKAPQQPVAAPAGAFLIFGKPVVPVAPPVGQTDYPADVKAWAGWGPLNGLPRKSFLVDGDWSSVLSAPGATKPEAAAVPWRVKVILLPSVDFLSPDAFGNLVERRSGIYAPTRERITQGLALAGALLQAQTGGRLAVSFDSSEDPALYEETVEEGRGLGPAALSAYVAPRINGGSFEANDKLYHGPYHVCLVIHAGLSEPAICEASHTTVFGVPAPIDDSCVSAFAAAALEAFEVAAGKFSLAHGRVPTLRTAPFAGVYAAFGDQPLDQVANDVGFGPTAGSDLVTALKAGPYRDRAWPGPPIQAESAVSANTQLAVTQDAEKGPVLSVKIGGVFSQGGFDLPLPKGLREVKRAPEHVLVFDVKTSSANVLGVGSTDYRDNSSVALGHAAFAGPEIPVPNDGTWHRVAIDLSLLKEGSVGGSEDNLSIGFLGNAARYSKASILPTEYSFSSFSLVAGAPADALVASASAGPDWQPRATAARAAVNAAGSPDSGGVLAQALADPDEMVRLNTLTALAANKVPGLEDKISACLSTINPRLSEASVSALAFQDTPTAWATLQEVLRVGPGTHAKVVAASFIAQRKDPASAGQISTLQNTARDWPDRLAAAKALAVNGTPQGLVFLREFLNDPDPCVRTTVAGLIPPSDEPGLRRLMFLSVNDSSDAARSAACIKLLQSPVPEIKREGYRGANDDSWWVRVQVLDWIAAHPSADDRSALQQAVTSPYGQVRAAALRALAKSPDPVTTEEIGNVLKDLDPAVQLELVALATAKKLALPAETLDMLKNSINPEVAAAAKLLAGS